MPTKEQVIEKVGIEMWEKMIKTGWIDGITVTSVSVVSIVCDYCGHTKQTEIAEPFDWGISIPCEKCGAPNGMHILECYESGVADIPDSDIDRAYRAANGEKILSHEFD